ncbi:ROK family protein [Streptomyces sp. GESEQ-35]|uniref:ROK family protein n=1 Tax=Streptomyces sp. GESEQ-35 TaxID=2812657 RepID=UPI001B321D57|nr:ROK family protein [Streptomyces sp. GESEQ-35]
MTSMSPLADSAGPVPLPVVPVLEVGGSHVTAAAVDLDRATIADGTRRRLPLTSGIGPEDFLAALAEAANGVLSATALGARAVGGTWGIAVPGPFDYARGIARYQGVGKFASLDGLAVGGLLTPRLSRRPDRLRFLNDASAFALGAWHAAHTGSRRLVAVTLGTGVGSAFLDRGTIVEDDPRVPPEGRVDLLTVDGRPLEDTVSTRAMTTHYTNRTGRPVDGLRELTALAAVDVIARDVITSALRALGGALAPWLTAFEADTVALGGSITAAWPLIGPPLAAGLTQDSPRLQRLALSVHDDGEDKALLGAAVFAARGA